MEREEIQKRLKKELDKNRYEHTLGVMYTAGSLAMAYGYDYEKAMIAGLLGFCRPYDQESGSEDRLHRNGMG